MDDLYTETFFKQEKEIAIFKEKSSTAILEEHPVEIFEATNQMYFNLDQLEKILACELENFSNFQFIFDKIREKLKTKSLDGVLGLLTEMEELLDLEIMGL